MSPAVATGQAMAEPERFIHADSGHRERAEIGEHTIVQACILAYVQTIGWTFMSRAEAEQRRHGQGGFLAEVVLDHHHQGVAKTYGQEHQHEGNKSDDGGLPEL